MTKAELIARIEEAEVVWRRLPDPDRRFRFGKMTSWPQYVRDFWEAYGDHGARVRLSAAEPSRNHARRRGA
jgi:hypothetical protein